MAATAAATVRELGQLRVDALQKACQERGLPANGRKDQLMARLIEANKARPARPQPQKPQKNDVVARPTEKDKVQASAFCPGGHRLVPFITTVPACGCDKCGKQFPKSTQLHSCRKCNYDECTNCVSKAEPHGCCPEGHRLVPFTTTVAGCGCDKCSKQFPKGTQLHGCRKCNYDECANCLSKAVSAKTTDAQGVKKALNGKPVDSGIRVAAPGTPKAASSSPLRKPDWLRSPAGKRGFESPQREVYPQSPGGMPRRRIRAKSPNPHRQDADWFMNSPACSRAALGLSPAPDGPRRRIREKSPDPHRHCGWDQELNFLGSPAALQLCKSRLAKSPNPDVSASTPATPGRRLRQKTSEWQIVLQENDPRNQPQPRTTTAKACSQTPVDPVQALLLLSRRELLEMCIDWGVSTAGAKSVLIDRLVDCHHKGREAFQSPPVPEVRVASPDVTIAVGPEAVSDVAPAAASNARVVVVPKPPSSWGKAPALPSSWASTQVAEPSAQSDATWERNQEMEWERITGNLGSSCSSSTKSAESEAILQTLPHLDTQPALAGSPTTPAKSTVTGTPTVLESEVAGTPTPARAPSRASSPVATASCEVVETSKENSSARTSYATSKESSSTASFESLEASKASSVETSKASAGSSNDWWRNVASRWPTIVANLKKEAAGTGGQKDAAPCSPPRSATKRSLGSPSIFESPKRHCPASAGGSPIKPNSP